MSEKTHKSQEICTVYVPTPAEQTQQRYEAMEDYYRRRIEILF